MLTSDDIKLIIESKERESSSIELKSYGKLNYNNSGKKDQRKEIASEIVALSNLNGGDLIFGIDDNGKIEGKLPLSFDKLKQDISQICTDLISPKILCDIQLLQIEENEIVVVNIPKRKGIPHCVIERKDNDEIKYRTYYLRTIHGKRLVSDNQLEWLFKHNEIPDFNHELRIGVQFERQGSLVGRITPFGNFSFMEFINGLRSSEIEELVYNSEKLGTFFIQCLSYSILKSILTYYNSSWYIGISRGFDRIASGPMRTQVENASIRLDEIEIIGGRILDSFSWDLKKILNGFFEYRMHIPLDTKLSINFKDDHKSSKITFLNPDFEFNINLNLLSWGAGLLHYDPDYQILFNRNPAIINSNIIPNYIHCDCACYFDAKFKFPGKNTLEFDKYLHYAKTLYELIDDNWNYDRLRGELPNKFFLTMDNKIEEILNLIKNK